MKLELIVDLGNGWQKIDGTPVDVLEWSLASGAAHSAGTSGVVEFSPARFVEKIWSFHNRHNTLGEFNGIIIGSQFENVVSYNFVKFTAKRK